MTALRYKVLVSVVRPGRSSAPWEAVKVEKYKMYGRGGGVKSDVILQVS